MVVSKVAVLVVLLFREKKEPLSGGGIRQREQRSMETSCREGRDAVLPVLHTP